MTNGITHRLKSGQQARLIPAIADSKKEERATSVLLAVMSMVPAFARSILSQVDVKVGKRTEIECLTEVVFKETSKKLRPDGLIVVRNGNKEWSALVESKVGNSLLKQDQLDDYIVLCREVDADALITISNQYAVKPDHHPLLIPRRHLRYVDAVHFSWLAILSQALLNVRENWISDIEQAYMIKELIRYLEDEGSGVSKTVRLGEAWTTVATRVQQGEKLRRTEESEEAVAGWHQILRFVSIQLTMQTGRYVSLFMSRQRQRDADLNFKTDLDLLLTKNIFEAEFEIPGCASRLKITVDLTRRNVELSSRLSAPEDRSRAQSSINWFVKQLHAGQEIDPLVRVYWPRSPVPSVAKLSDIAEHGAGTLIKENKKGQLPVTFEAVWLIDLGSRLKGRKIFVDDLTGAVPTYFGTVLEPLKAWAKPVSRGKSKSTRQELELPEQVLALPVPVDPIPSLQQREADEVPRTFRISPARERRYLDDRYN